MATTHRPVAKPPEIVPAIQSALVKIDEVAGASNSEGRVLIAQRPTKTCATLRLPA
jgi:hypothetical protein